MNPGIMLKTAREVRLLVVITTAAVLLLEVLLVGLTEQLSEQLRQFWQQIPVAQRLVRMLVGAELGDSVGTTGFLSIGYAHPILFACVWTLILASTSRAVAGEIDRGTADLLLTLPVSRRGVYVSSSVVFLLAGVPLCAAVPTGMWIGTQIIYFADPPDLGRLSLMAISLMALYVCVTGASMLASSVFSRRGPAIAVVLGWLLVSFLLNFLGQLWSIFGRLGFIGALRYYRPLPVIRDGELPWGDLGALVGGGVIFWLIGLWRFSRRDIPAA